MPEQTPVTLNHFGLASFTPAYWTLPADARRDVRCGWLERLRNGTDAVHLYQTFGLGGTADLLMWTAVRQADRAAPARFFRALAEAVQPYRAFIRFGDPLWGFTRPSQYTKTRSTQELEPFQGGRGTFLVVYPFVKSAEWYLAPREQRHEMMMGHIKVGKQYPEITQLLLYSFGLQDQEFVVVYEMADVQQFSRLVEELRGTAARPYTVRDWPLHAGIRQTEAELETWL